MDSFTLMFMYGCTYYVMSTSSNPWFIHRSGQQSLVAPTSENFSSPTNVPLDGNRFFHKFFFKQFSSKNHYYYCPLDLKPCSCSHSKCSLPYLITPKHPPTIWPPHPHIPPSLLAFLLQFPSNSSIHILPLNGS